MQICYRCEEKTNELLEKMAKKNGVSKNHLIDEIIKEYLGYGIKNNQNFHPSHTESKLLPASQYATRGTEQYFHLCQQQPGYKCE